MGRQKILATMDEQETGRLFNAANESRQITAINIGLGITKLAQLKPRAREAHLVI